MRLSFFADDYALEISIHSYQFERSSCPYDSNWLFVSARYTTEYEAFVVTDAALMTSDLKGITTFIADQTANDSCLEFMEPSLRFGWQRNKLGVATSYGLAPPWLPSEE